MAWAELVKVLVAELGPTGAAALDRAIRAAFGGERVYIPAVDHVDCETAAQAVLEAPSVKVAAQRLGVHPTTAYRKLREWRRIR